MTSLVEVYWQYLGAFLGRIIGFVIDLFPIALSEVLLQLALWGTLILLLAFWKKVPVANYYYLAPITLFIMVGSQGISAIDWVPTAHRRPIVEALELGMMDQSSLDKFLDGLQDQLNRFPEDLYREAPMDPPMELINRSMQKAIKDYNLVAGREVRSVKKLWGVTRVLGLAYGGPAYHDVITSEVVVASHKDYPASKAWRWMCVMHETAHAQGYTREMDAEILTWLALYKSDDPLLKSLADLMACFKTGQKYVYPKVLMEEWHEIRKQRKSLDQPLIEWFKLLAEKVQIQNSGAKYGTIDRGHQIPLDHELFRALVHLSK